jgi:hypothetical protein
MEANILKPDTGSVPFERPSQISSKQTSAGGSSGDLSPTETGNRGYVEPVSEGEEDESMDMAPANDEHKRTGLSGAEVEEAIAFRERMLKERQHESAVQDDESEDERTPFLKTRRASSHHILGPRPRILSIDPLAPSSAFDNTLRNRLKESAARDEHDDGDGDDEGDDTPQPSRSTDDRILSREFTAPAGKRIAVPVRIEPKVYFASERTFLKWLHFSIYVGTIATTLLNFIEPGDTHGLIAAMMFTFVALLTIAYATVVFVYRSLKLRTRSAEGLYYDKWGPSLLCIALVAALAANVGMRLSEL